MSRRILFTIERHPTAVASLAARYNRHAEYDAIQVAVIDLASKGPPQTVADVVVHLHVDPSRAETFLDHMARDGRVDLEVDETRGAVVYSMCGLGTSIGRLLPDVHQIGWRMPSRRHPRLLNNITIAVI